MKKKINLILWLFCIATYIFNIVAVCIYGATITNNILAWCLCIFLVIVIILLDKRYEHLYKSRSIEYQWCVKMLKWLTETKQEFEDQKEQKTENKEVNDE